jgi:hypothetical protein
MKTRTFILAGYSVSVYRKGNKSFYYPDFNSNAEFSVTSKGFRLLSRYIRTVHYLHNISLDYMSSIRKLYS